jgi:hypothetical protein
MNLNARLTYRLVLATDIEGYSRRNAEQQRCAQADLCRVLGSAAQRAGLDRDRWHRQDRGDGELAVLPERIDVLRAVGDLTRHMAAALAELNGGRPAHRLLRVRLALHHGTLTAGPLGPAGDAPIVASRLVDADAGRRYLHIRPEHDMVVIVSASLYNDVIATGYCSLDPADFTDFRAVIKDRTYDGYIYCARPGGGSGTGIVDRVLGPTTPPHHGAGIGAGARFARHTAGRRRATTQAIKRLVESAHHRGQRDGQYHPD